MKTGKISKSLVISRCAMLALLTAGIQASAGCKTSANETLIKGDKVILKRGKSVLTADKIILTKEDKVTAGHELSANETVIKGDKVILKKGKSILTAGKITLVKTP